MCRIFDKEELNIIGIGAVKCLPKALERNRHLLNRRMVYRELLKAAAHDLRKALTSSGIVSGHGHGEKPAFFLLS